MAIKSNQTYAGIGSEAVAAKTGRSWDQWFSLLDKQGAVAWPHKEIANFIHAEHGCPSWWCQMITVGFEQARGLRVKHQVADGFSTSASRTIAVPVSILYEAWALPRKRAKWLTESSSITIRKATPNRSMRITWSDDTNVDVGFWSKGESKCQVAIEQRKLKSLRDVARSKAYWSKALVRLQELLERQVTSGRTAAVKRKSGGGSRGKPIRSQR